MAGCTVVLGTLPDGVTPIVCMLTAGHDGQHVAHVRRDLSFLDRLMREHPQPEPVVTDFPAAVADTRGIRQRVRDAQSQAR